MEALLQIGLDNKIQVHLNLRLTRHLYESPERDADLTSDGGRVHEALRLVHGVDNLQWLQHAVVLTRAIAFTWTNALTNALAALAALDGGTLNVAVISATDTRRPQTVPFSPQVIPGLIEQLGVWD